MNSSSPAATFLAAALATAAPAQPAYTEDFQSFTLAPIDQQLGWASPAGTDAAVVEDASFNRALRYQRLPGEDPADRRTEWGLVGAPIPAAYGRLGLDVAVSAEGDTNDHNRHHLATEDPLTGLLNTRVEFTSAGEILVYSPAGFGLTFGVDPIASSTFTPGETLRLAIETTPAGVLRVYQNGALIHEGQDLAAVALGPDRAGKIGRVSAWSQTEHANTGAPASSITIDNITFTRTRCPADLNNDGAVDASDLASVLARWEDARLGGQADIDADGVIGAIDLATFLAGWGECPT